MLHGRVIVVYCVLALGALIAFLASLANGAVQLGFAETWRGLWSPETLAHSVIVDLRLPRSLTAFAAGGALALAGALMQVLLRNPLADPYVMGVSGGAAIAALSAMLLGLSGLSIDLAAMTGAFAATLLVFALARGQGGWTPTRLLLTGVIVASASSAIVALLLSLGDDVQLRSMMFWLMGDLAFSARPGALVMLFLAAMAATFPFARHLNVLARSEVQAHLLGAPVHALRVGIFIATSVLTGACVTAAGAIGFIGLVTPHLTRLLLGSDHRLMLPATALLGGVLVTLADLCARTLFAPRQLPVGALTALLGAPMFLYLMQRRASTGVQS